MSWDDFTSTLSDAFSGNALCFVIGVPVFIILVIVLATVVKTRCDVCGAPFVNVSYIWIPFLAFIEGLGSFSFPNRPTH